MNQPRLSFVMPTKNRDQLIGETISSLQAQTVTDWELIIVDDHSDPTDRTEQVINQIGDPRIRYYRLPDEHGRNSPSARNFGNALAAAPIIAVCDSDDIYYPNRAEITLAAFAHENCDVFYANYDKWDPATDTMLERTINPVVPFSEAVFHQYDPVPHGTAAYTRHIAQNFPYNSFLRRSADYDLFSRLAQAGKKFSYSPEKVYRHRQHQQSITGTTPYQIFDHYIWQSRGWEIFDPRVAQKIIGEE